VTAEAAIYRARWLIPARGPAMEDAAAVCLGGRIVRIGAWRNLSPHVGPNDSVEHFPDACLLPAFINAHAHLGLSDLAGKFEPTADFAGWITRLVAKRLLRTDRGTRRAVREGLDQGLSAGTVAGADVTPDAECDDGISQADGRWDGRWTVFGEVVQFGRAGLRRLERTVDALESLAKTAPVAPGLSPHAPYSTGLEVFMAVRRAADERGWPVTTHLHETLDEIAFTERGEGTLYDLIKDYHLLPRDWRPAGVRPIRMLAEAGFFAAPVLVAHGNYLTDEDIAVLAKSGSSVAYCPRSHAFFGHEAHPWRRLLAAGASVCLGTDSLASSPTLSILDEMRFLAARHPDADPRTILQMGTVRGAAALGLEGDFGDLGPGLAAALCVAEPHAPTLDPLAAILAGPVPRVRLLRP